MFRFEFLPDLLRHHPGKHQLGELYKSSVVFFDVTLWGNAKIRSTQCLAVNIIVCISVLRYLPPPIQHIQGRRSRKYGIFFEIKFAPVSS